MRFEGRYGMKPILNVVSTLSVMLCLVMPTTASVTEDLDDYLETVRAEYQLPALAAAVVRNGEIVAAGAVGTRVLGRDIPVTLGDRFHIGSDTKAMTATIAGALVEEGLIAWDSTIGGVLGTKIADLDPELAAVTLEQLLSHSSGIPSDDPEMIEIYMSNAAFDLNIPDTRLHAIDRWKHNTPQVPDVSPFQYSNFGYLIAGAMLEEISGVPWERLIQERVFEPLELHTAGLGPQASTGNYDAAIGHMLDQSGKATPMLWGPAADVPPVLGPAGSGHMSILDFAKWAGWNAGEGTRQPAIVSPETLADIHRPRVHTPPRPNPIPGTPAEGEYALGWGVVSYEWADRPLLSHNGSNSMNLAKILVDVKDDLGIVVATNFPGREADMAASEVEQRLYEQFGGKK